MVRNVVYPAAHKQKEDSIMDGTTTEDRKKELKILLTQMEAHPSRDWTAERARVAVLQKIIATGNKAETAS